MESFEKKNKLDKYVVYTSNTISVVLIIFCMIYADYIGFWGERIDGEKIT